MKFKKSIANLYRQYELATCINMFEPWEKRLINGFLVIILSLITISGFIYLPSYMVTLIQSITPQPWTSQSATNSFAPIMQTQKMRMG